MPQFSVVKVSTLLVSVVPGQGQVGPGLAADGDGHVSGGLAGQRHGVAGSRGVSLYGVTVRVVGLMVTPTTSFSVMETVTLWSARAA